MESPQQGAPDGNVGNRDAKVLGGNIGNRVGFIEHNPVIGIENSPGVFRGADSRVDKREQQGVVDNHQIGFIDGGFCPLVETGFRAAMLA
ncbi:MAG: hypothetical protein BWY82_02596 [Verrucomicrobia bacterium ADurb.Bin474]|nr:MAG: hypothetical protein BWY82_02596 [Verrucomicrobia bacterium ADurb.Bin474]